MTTHVSGQAATIAAAQTLTAHRRAIMDLLVGEPLITTAEYDTAMQRTQACTNILTLQKWYRNTVREIARREEAAGMAVGAQAQALANMAQGIERFDARVAEAQEAAPATYATTAQKEEIIRLGNSTYILRKEKTAALLKLPHLDEPQAVALIGELWAKILRRQERAAEGHESASDSFSIAA